MTMENDLRRNLERAIESEIDSGGFGGSYTLEEMADKPHFRAGIDIATLSKIEFGVNPAYETNHPGKTVKVVGDVTKHEIDHRGYEGLKGCPRTTDNHADLIIEPIAKVLKAKGYSAGDFHYLANTLEDTILHSDLSRRFKLDGIEGFFEDVGENSEKKQYTPFYEAHVRLNNMLWASKSQKADVSPFFTHDEKERKKIIGVLKKFLEKSGIDELKFNGARDRQQIRDYINDEKNWPLIAGAYAESFSELMTPNYAMNLPNHSGNGTKGQEKEKKQGREQENESNEGNEFDKKMNGKEFKKGRIRRAYENGEKMPSWMDSFEGLDLLYQNLAQKLNIKAETFTEQAKMPTCWYGKRDFDPDKDNLKHVTFGFDDSGKVALKKKRWHESIPLHVKHLPKGFPEARFCLLDTSSSMREDPNGGDRIGSDKMVPWGDNSKYHHALMAWYGMLEYLKQNHLLSQMSVGLGNFSDPGQTEIANGLEEAKRLALNPKFGNTAIDSDKLSKIFADREKLVFTVSDGDIQNWDEIRRDFINGAKKHHYFHLQIGPSTEASADLKKAGLKVVPIRSSEDLASTVIDLTDNIYRGGQR